MRGGPRFLRRLSIGDAAAADDDEEEEPNLLELSSDELFLSLGPVSDTLLPFLREQYIGQNQVSLKVSGAEISRHDQAVQLLERLANSLFLKLTWR